jgi:radical SAM superfamily enzyme YgiQ (UPF0313 family)
MMHAVICMLNSKYVHSSLAPWYLLTGVIAYCDKGITAEVVEGTVNQDLAVLADTVISRKPDVIGFCCYIWNITAVKKLLPIIKAALPEAVIVLGGPEVSYNAGEILGGEPLVDIVLAGEGEKPFALLLNALYAGEQSSPLRENPGIVPVGAICDRPPAVPGETPVGAIINRPPFHPVALDSIPGLCCRKDGQLAVKPPHLTTDEPPDPYGEEYFAALRGRIAYIETSRGCPFSCAFCLSGGGQSVRWFSMERAKRDIVRLAQSGTQTVKFVDRTFNADKTRAREIFRFITAQYGQSLPEGVCFHFEIAGDLLDEETLALLAMLPKGAVQFEIGLQSFNEGTLAAVCRKTDTARLKENIARLIAMGNIHVHIDLIAGLPHEDLQTFAGSFDTAYALRPHMLQLGFLKLLYGSAMRAQPEAFPCRYASEPPYEVLETPWLPPGDLCKLHEAEAALGRLYNSGRFRRTLAYVLDKAGIRPFDLFCQAGRLLAGKGSLSLDALTALIFEYFKSLFCVDPDALRDQMVRDRLATNASGKLPAVLKRPSHGVSGARRGKALLSAESVLVAADYAQRDPVTGEYGLKETILLRTDRMSLDNL